MLRIVVLPFWPLCLVIGSQVDSTRRTACALDPTWRTIAEYKNVPGVDDVPDDVASLRTGFSRTNAFYVGDEDLKAAIIDDLSICMIESTTCRMTCQSLAALDKLTCSCNHIDGWPSMAHKIAGVYVGVCGTPSDGSPCSTVANPYAFYETAIANPWTCPASRGAQNTGTFRTWNGGPAWHFDGNGMTLGPAWEKEIGWGGGCRPERMGSDPDYDAMLLRIKEPTTTTTTATTTTATTTSQTTTSQLLFASLAQHVSPMYTIIATLIVVSIVGA